jgi:dipeptidyl aminopeptidase/acylaminoacyl peptidase
VPDDVHSGPQSPTAFHDLARFVALPRIGGLALSPDGSRLVAPVATLSPDRKKYVTALWEIDPAGARPARRLTRSAPGEASPAFLPDGGLLFTSRRPDAEAEKPDDEVPALWLLPAGGGESRQLAARPLGIGAVRAAREAGTVVFSAASFAGSASAEDDEKRKQDRKDADVNAILHESSPIRYWDHDLGPSQVRLFAADQPAGEARLGEPKDLTPEPGRALDEQGFDVAPDGSTVVTAWATFDTPGYPHEQLVAIDVASGAQRVLARADDHAFGDPVVSPDGRRVACIRHRDSTWDLPPDNTLWLVDLDTGEGRDLTPDLDLWPAGPAWAQDGSAVFFHADENGRSPAYRVDLDSGALTRLTDDGAYSELRPSPDGRFLYALRARIDQPATPVRLDARAADQVDAPVLPSPADVGPLPGTVTEVSTTAEDGATVRAWLVLPEGASAAQPAPLLLWIHGGPLMSWNAWSWRWCPWLMAARGYAVLLPDPALSQGYGEKFMARGWGQWGGAPFTDLMAITDEALKRPDLDAGRTAAMGGSYGGYMANWVAGHTDRFRCIVTHASLWALDAFTGATDVPAYWVREWGHYDENPERYDAWSPHRHLDKIVTPMLVVHGDKDYRVPVGEGLRLWWDLQRHGVESKFLYFPDENHWVLKPGDAQVWYQTVLAFLARHVLGEEWARPGLL